MGDVASVIGSGPIAGLGDIPNNANGYDKVASAGGVLDLSGHTWGRTSSTVTSTPSTPGHWRERARLHLRQPWQQSADDDNAGRRRPCGRPQDVGPIGAPLSKASEMELWSLIWATRHASAAGRAPATASPGQATTGPRPLTGPSSFPAGDRCPAAQPPARAATSPARHRQRLSRLAASTASRPTAAPIADGVATPWSSRWVLMV